MNKAAYVYAIVCIPMGERYIGCSTNLAERWTRHRHLLRKGRHHSSRLQSAWKEHGARQFSFEIIETIPRATREMRLLAEARWVQKLGTLNTMPSEDGRRFTVRGADRASRRIAALELIASDPAYRGFLTARGKALAEAIQTTEGRAAMAAHTRRRWRDPEERKKLQRGLENRWADPEARERQAAATKAAMTPEARARHAGVMKAAWADPNSALRNRSGGRWADPEAKKRQADKMRAAHAARRAAKAEKPPT